VRKRRQTHAASFPGFRGAGIILEGSERLENRGLFCLHIGNGMSTALRFTLAEYDRMIEQGVLDGRGDLRTELIYGEIREMSPPGPTHEQVTDLLARWSFDNTDPRQIRVRIQNSIAIPKLDCAPQPDVAWVVEKDYSTRRPQPAEVLLVIEVAASSLAGNRGEKAALYARAKIVEYWVVNLQDWQVEVHREPHRGAYRRNQTYTLHESIHPLAKPEVSLPVSLLFQPASK
jgi:Uma2 family endonuclease